METDFRRRLHSEYLKLALDAINADMTIGPNAPGDGDLVQWYSTVCCVGVLDLKQQQEQGSLRSIDEFFLGTQYKWSKGKFVNALADMGEQLFATAFPDPDPAPILVDNVLLHHWLIMQELIHQWGNRSPYIHKRRKIRNMRDRVRDALAQQIPVEEIAEKIGISRATVFRILKEKN
jgi:hypothetical protein